MTLEIIASYSTIISGIIGFVSLIISVLVLKQVANIKVSINSNIHHHHNPNTTTQNITGSGNRTAGGTYNE